MEVYLLSIRRSDNLENDCKNLLTPSDTNFKLNKFEVTKGKHEQTTAIFSEKVLPMVSKASISDQRRH